MECKKCKTTINIAVAAESGSTIKRFCEAAGMAPEAVASFVSLRTPLCRKCMEHWELGEEELKPRTA